MGSVETPVLPCSLLGSGILVGTIYFTAHFGNYFAEGPGRDFPGLLIFAYE